MTREEFLAEIDQLVDLAPGTLKGPEELDSIEEWNSTAMIGLIALADTNNRVRLSPRQIAACSTVTDLLKLAGVEA